MSLLASRLLARPRGTISLGRPLSVSASTPDSLVHNDRSYPYRWLRDACQCASCIQKFTRQKLSRTSDVPHDIRPQADGVRAESDAVSITWNDGHQSRYSTAFLKRYRSSEYLRKFHKDIARKEWDASTVRDGDLFLSYDTIRTPTGLLSGITQLLRYGLLFVTGVPTEHTDNKTCELRSLAHQFGELRHTFYGLTWDVKNVQNSRNIAYTNVNLGLHMDLLYFQHPPRYQILHCLRNRVEGGKSIFVDAAHVAKQLRKEDPPAFETLATTPVAFHYINDGHHLHHSHPTIQLSPFARDKAGEREIEFINYSPPFQAPLALNTPPEFYTALSRYASMLEDPSVRFEYLLREGDAVLFDNRRVLHARTAFYERDGQGDEGDGETNRWLKGCYLEADAVLDKSRVLEAKLGRKASRTPGPRPTSQVLIDMV